MARELQVIHFVLLAHVRSGSTVLVRSLADHTNVRMFGELFHAEESERARTYSQIRLCHVAHRLGINRSMYYHEGDDGGQFIGNNVFYKRYYEEIIKSVGFKLFASQARDNPNAKKAWQYLLDHKEIRIIHLFRLNLLETYLSYRLALITNEWALLEQEAGHPRADAPQLRLEAADCAAFFNRIIAEREWIRNDWSGHPFLELSYESDLCNTYESTVYRIEDFLRVGHEPARKRLAKQSRRSPREQITNYGELKEHFRYSIHEAYFE
jgi:LPS sulfotransferase NodH